MNFSFIKIQDNQFYNHYFHIYPRRYTLLDKDANANGCYIYDQGISTIINSDSTFKFQTRKKLCTNTRVSIEDIKTKSTTSIIEHFDFWQENSRALAIFNYLDDQYIFSDFTTTTTREIPHCAEFHFKLSKTNSPETCDYYFQIDSPSFSDQYNFQTKSFKGYVNLSICDFLPVLIGFYLIECRLIQLDNLQLT